MDALFVYGTLMREQCRHHVFPPERLLAACPARVAGRLLDLGAFPAMVEHEDPEDHGWVQGELFLVRDLDGLLPLQDQVEGCTPGSGALFRRARCSVETGCIQHEAWVYVLAPGARPGPAIPSASWRFRSLTRPPAEPTPLQGLHEVLRMIPWRCDGPDSTALLPEGAVMTWGGADFVVVDRPSPPPAPEDDPWGRCQRITAVATPHALALGWLTVELWERVCGRGLLLDKYSFFEALGRAALDVLDAQPRASERALAGAMWCAAAELVTVCGWEARE